MPETTDALFNLLKKKKKTHFRLERSASFLVQLATCALWSCGVLRRWEERSLRVRQI